MSLSGFVLREFPELLSPNQLPSLEGLMVPILIVDDAQEDLVFAQRVLSANRIVNPILPFSSGKACLDYFHGKSSAYEAQFPCVVLLDMVMKPVGGLDVLRALQDLPAAKGSVVILLSGLADIKMVSEGYRLGASTFLIKPLVAAELKRVCRQGGKIIMGNWTPTGFVGQMFKVHGKYVSPPALMAPPVKWGDEEIVRERLSDGTSHLKLSRRLYPFRYPFPPNEVVEFFRTYYGPSHKAFAALDAEKQSALQRELEQLWTEHNTATDGTTFIESEYLEVPAIRK